MKPSELSNEELAKAIHNVPIDRRELPTKDDWFSALDVVHEAAARLRNSIPKPVVSSIDRHGEERWRGDTAKYTINGVEVWMLEDIWDDLRTALGINDTEGGV